MQKASDRIILSLNLIACADYIQYLNILKMKEKEWFNGSRQNVPFSKKHSLLLFILLPAIAVLLGWGLRGFIGGGPYGALIPGAMVTLTICMLLDVPLMFAAIALVFGTTGTAMGGDMTYGQTLGFLKNPDTVWWGFAGTSLKGGVWGLISGTFIALGLVYQRIKVKTILIGFLIFLILFAIGLKLINDPRILYFSNPVDQPRDESWAGLLFAVIGLLVYLKIKAGAEEFKVLKRFALFGAVGGVLGFGLGSLWITVGSQYGDQFLIVDWWKMMEFSFGLTLGGFLGYAAWGTNLEWHSNSKKPAKLYKIFSIEVIASILIAFFLYATIPLFESFLETIKNQDGIGFRSLMIIGRVFISAAFIGPLLILIAMRWPYLSFQIAVTITFCHCVIDLVTDDRLFPSLQSSPFLIIVGTIIVTLVVSVLVAIYQRKHFVLRSMFLILVWSTMAVAVVRMIASGEFNFKNDHSFSQILIGDLFVFNVFMISAIAVSAMVLKNKNLKSRYLQNNL
ncbi:MAG: hypothetical protein ABI325_12710 [Ginsengibacter sp.]